jgi:hypothetical protein
VQMARKDKETIQHEVMARKRLAMQIAAQLPADEEEALAVLEYAKTIVRSFLADPRPV